jgi:Iap family predicted aminopeptidase
MNQPVKSGKILVHYPCIFFSSIEHRSRKCPSKIKIHDMFKTKHVSYNAIITPKPSKIDNVLVNVVADVTTRSQ